jgi:hypothetical protein
MFNSNQKTNQPTICNFVPGYAYYDGIGYRLAEHLTNLVEWMLGFRR